jgi:hypothetical protein
MPLHAAKIANGLRLCNRSVIVNSFGVSSSPANTVRIARNFIVHKNPSTSLQLTKELQRAVDWADVAGWVSTRSQGRTEFGLWVQSFTDIAYAAVR